MVAGYGPAAVPFNELYTPGGVNWWEGTMIRGYLEQSVGPRNASGTPIGGHSQLIFNVEMSLPIVKQQFFGLAFFDAGNSWERVGETSLFDLRRSLGFGVRIMTPVLGVMGFDFAWGLDRRRVDGAAPQMVTHFQIGPQFF